jgi:four helix bundle protein
MSKVSKMPKVNERQPAMARDVKKFAKELEKRTKRFVIDIILLSSSLSNTPEGRAVRTQITKSGTSVGANYREANRARSRAAFKNKIAISETEASETQYWLEVVVGVGWKSWDKIESEYDECNELLALATSMGTK